jgi:hypothetical protein
MGDVGGDDVDGAGRHVELFAADRHFQRTLHDVGDLFMDVVMFRGYAAFFDIPEDEGAGIAVDHFPEKAGKCLFYRDIAEILHRVNFG